MKRRTVSVLGTALLATGAIGGVVPQTAVAATPEGCSHVSSSYRPLLKYGHTGVAVEQAQCLTNVWGGVPKLIVDGVFGDRTLTKIKWIQGCHGLPKDGIVGPDTWNVLYNPVPDCYDPYPPQ
ncbi:hypothetical protein GCM10020367_23560 [Streptomyces sannanensis]|uniref:Peptidoglycan binding-like domain-containing protein n=1 Tax=Streptomyces sannanensis TaxID=285536 RepID=A0ABP6S9W4_9ACTN